MFSIKNLIAIAFLSIALVEYSKAESKDLIVNANASTSGTTANSNTGRLRSVSGYVKDSKTGEALIGATVYIREIKAASSTNQYGFYSVSMLPGDYNIDFSYVGYATINKSINLKDNLVINLELEDDAKLIEEVVVKTDRPEDKIRRPEMSISKLEMKAIKKVPAILGETDVIKVLQMLPGVQSTAEGTSGFSVRGGGIDQNLIILDEATVYNASHLMGFFSVFNNDAVRDVKLYKGDIPAAYGGRLSSVVDVRMKEGNAKKFSVTGGIGLLSSRLTVESPIPFQWSNTEKAQKTSFIVSGRRTYADLFFPLATDTNLKKSKMYFYDLNMKINHTFNDNNRLFVSAYLGRDIFGQKDNTSEIGFGNKTVTLRWNHVFNSRLFSNFTATYANYDYKLMMTQGGSEYNWTSNLIDYAVKADFNYYINTNNELRFGWSSTYHELTPCNTWIENKKDKISLSSNSDGSVGFRENFPINYSLEHGFYASNQQKLGDKLTLKYGLRYSIFQNLGSSTYYKYDSSYEVYDTVKVEKGKIFNTYNNFEPRLGLNFQLDEKSSVKASYSKTAQFLQLASNSNGGMPLDIWFPASPNVKPQLADQYAIGYLRNIFGNKVEASIETYYKDMKDVVDFKDHAQLLMNKRMEGDIRTGTAYSYGAEFMLKKADGRVNGWISYTYSRAYRKIKEINEGKKYSTPYDKPHNVSVILNYEITQKVTLSANWIYATGAPVTFPVGSFEYGNVVNKIYSKRNGYRMRDYHRLDLSVTLAGKRDPDRFWHGEWVFSLYNAYGRHNDWMINFVNEEKSNKLYAERWYLPFVFLPGITYNFHF